MFDRNPSPAGEGDARVSGRESPPSARATPLTLGTLLAVGCDPTSPEPPPLSVEVSGPETTLVAPEALPGNNIACTVPLQAAAVGGRPGEAARWTGTLLDLRTYDRDGELLDAPAHPMSRAWTADLWGGETLAAGDTARVEPLFHRPGQGIERWDGTVQFTWEAVDPEDPESAEERLTEPVWIDCLLDPADARYEKGSIVLTSNKHVRDWPEIFAGDEILTTAILDRLLHHVHIVHIDERSYRLRELDGLLAQQPEPAPQSKGGSPTKP